MLPGREVTMGYSHDDWLRDQGRIPGINLDKIRFGYRVEPRKTLDVPYLGERDGRVELSRKKRDARGAEEEGFKKFQLRLW
jgi:hypothetical protein